MSGAVLVRAHESAPRGEAGFTLAEMLVALALFGMVSALLAAVVNLIVRLDGSSRRQGEAVDAIVSAQTVLRARLEQMNPIIDIHGLGDTIALVGKSDEVTFTAPGFAAAGRHQLQLIRLRRTNLGQLVLYSAPDLAGNDLRAPSVEGWNAAPLLDHVDWLEITYFGPDKITRRDVWTDDWVQRALPPKLVRIRLGFAGGDPRLWPVLMVRPLSGQRLPCQDGRRTLDCGDAP